MKYNDNGTYKDIYVKAFDTLPVGTEVDYDGNTVPSGWTEITGKNIITVGLSTDYTLNDSNARALPYNTIVSQIGDKLTLNNAGKLEIGEGINHILVSSQITYNNVGTSGTSARNYIRKNHSGTNSYLSIGYSRTSSVATPQITVPSGMVLASVSEGDIIDVVCQAGGGGTVIGDVSQTYLTIIVID